MDDDWGYPPFQETSICGKHWRYDVELKHNTQKHKKHLVDECDLQKSAIESIQMLKFESATAESTWSTMLLRVCLLLRPFFGATQASAQTNNQLPGAIHHRWYHLIKITSRVYRVAGQINAWKISFTSASAKTNINTWYVVVKSHCWTGLDCSNTKSRCPLCLGYDRN